MNKISINDKRRSMKEIWSIARFLDEARWGKENKWDHDNYYLINECSEDITDETRILSHYVTYCVNRQTPFKLVFELGGFIFSDMISTLQTNKSLHILNPFHPDSYFIPDGADGYVFQSHRSPHDNRIIMDHYEHYRQQPDKLVRFKPRFYPRDYMSILNTFVFLEKYDYLLTGYLMELMDRFYHQPLFLKRVLFGLHLMSYRNIGQFKKTDLKDYGQNVQLAIENRQTVRDILDNPAKFDKAFELFQQKDMYHQKRLWCSLRDYLKCGYYRNSLLRALDAAGCRNYVLFEHKHLLNQLELPGDVWNNNPRFWKCILQHTGYTAITKEYNRHLRKMIQEQDIQEAYPEMFDFTFDFVSRMCMQEKCSICIFREMKEPYSTVLKKICVNHTDAFCPLAMMYCHYQMKCKSADCDILPLL